MSPANADARRIRWHSLRPCKSFLVVPLELSGLCGMYFSISHTYRHYDPDQHPHWKAILKAKASKLAVKRPAPALSISDVGPSWGLTSARLPRSTLLASLSTLYFTLLQLQVLLDDLFSSHPGRARSASGSAPSCSSESRGIRSASIRTVPRVRYLALEPRELFSYTCLRTLPLQKPGSTQLRAVSKMKTAIRQQCPHLDHSSTPR